MIKLRNLERRYPLAKEKFFYVLREINLDVEEGDFVSIMGPSGAGKSTLLHILGMHDHGWCGEYFLGETAVHHLKPKERATLRNEQIGLLLAGAGTYCLALSPALARWISPHLLSSLSRWRQLLCSQATSRPFAPPVPIR